MWNIYIKFHTKFTRCLAISPYLIHQKRLGLFFSTLLFRNKFKEHGSWKKQIFSVLHEGVYIQAKKSFCCTIQRRIWRHILAVHFQKLSVNLKRSTVHRKDKVQIWPDAFHDALKYKRSEWVGILLVQLLHILNFVIYIKGWSLHLFTPSSDTYLYIINYKLYFLHISDKNYYTLDLKLWKWGIVHLKYQLR